MPVPDEEEVDQVQRRPRDQQVQHQRGVEHRGHRVVEMPAPIAYQMIASTMITAIRQARLVVTLRNESIPVSTVSIAP